MTHSTSQPFSHSSTNSQLCSAQKASNTPPHKLLLETSFTCSPVTSPNQRPDLKVHALAHALSWELVSALEEQLLTSGIPQGYQIGCPDVPSGQWASHAPLASPETLSDTSSISSRLSVLLKEAFNNNSSPSPPASPSQSRKTGSRHNRLNNSSNNSNDNSNSGSNNNKAPSTLTLLHQSPKVAPRKAVAPLGQGYCFYIDAPPSSEVANLPPPPVQPPDVPSPDDRFITSPAHYITLSPIVPNTHGSNQEKEGIKDTLSKLFASIDRPPFVLDMDDDGNGSHTDFSPTKSSTKGRSVDYLDNSSIEGFLDDDAKFGDGSRRSSLSLNPGQTVSQELTTSQMSRDSGYGERGTSGRQSSGTLAEGVDEGKTIVYGDFEPNEVNLECKTWGDTQQEYGRGVGPPHLPHYAYCGSSPQHSALKNGDCGSPQLVEDEKEPLSSSKEESEVHLKLGDHVHPLHIATPLLHSITPSRKAAETSL